RRARGRHDGGRGLRLDRVRRARAAPGPPRGRRLELGLLLLPVSSGQLAALAGLVALHGGNPAMGWLFAAAMGLQERSRAAVVRALGPIGLGHALSVALVVVLVEATSSFVPANAVRIGGALLLLAFGTWKLLARRTHPRFVGLRLSPLELAGWSFLMSSAHG